MDEKSDSNNNDSVDAEHSATNQPQKTTATTQSQLGTDDTRQSPAETARSSSSSSIINSSASAAVTTVTPAAGARRPPPQHQREEEVSSDGKRTSGETTVSDSEQQDGEENVSSSGGHTQHSISSGTTHNTDTTSATSSATSRDVTPRETSGPLNHTAARKCYYCGKRFTKLGDFRQHLVSHLGKKAFKCRDCGRRFRVKSNLLFHQQAAHGPVNQLSSVVSPDHASGQSDLSMLRTAPDPLVMSSETPAKMAADSGGESSNKSSPPEGADGQSSSANKKPGTNGFSPHSSTGSGGSLERELSYSDEFIMEYPSQFPGLKHQISIKNETVLITRLDGTNLTTGEKSSLYKCHMCGKVFNFLSKLQCHLSLHFERHMTLYQCTYCDAHFKFKTLLLQHLRTGHGVHVSSRSDIPDVGAISPELESPTDDQSMSLGEGGGGEGGDGPGPKPSSSFSAASSSAAMSSLRESTAGSYLGDRGSEVRDTQGGPERPGSGNEDSLGSEEFLNATNGGQYYSAHSFGGKPLYDKVNGLYICQFCNKSFDRLFSLHRHERVHTGYKPCYCTYCGRGFSEPRNLRHHMIRFHSDGSQIHLIKRMRKKPTVDSGLSRTSQRLPLVTPEMIARANQADVYTRVRPTQQDEAYNQSSNQEEAYSRAPPNQDEEYTSSSSKADVAPSRGDTRSDESRPETRGSEPSAGRPSRSPIIVEPRYGRGEPPAKKLLASEIREKERLDEDVTVVIPSDVPFDVAKDRNMQTPKSTMSDNTSWSGNLSEGEGDHSPLGGGGAEIMSAPVKSIMGGYSSLRTSKRKHSTPTQPSPPRDEPGHEEESGRADTHVHHARAGESPDAGEKDTKPDMNSLTSAHHHFLSSMVSSSGSELKYHPTSTPMSLPFSPLSISTFVNPGLAGLMPSPMMSPLGQAALFGQHGLTSPNMVGNPLPFFPPIPSAAAAAALAATTATTTTTSKETATSSGSGSSVTSPGLAEMESRMEDYPSWMAKGGSRGSSLSRTHSRLYVVNKPVKREDVCKPTVLPDGRTVYRCSYCNKDFCTFSDVNRHMDFHEDIRPYKCKFCDYYARTNSQLKVHMMRHQGIREFHCKLCNYKGVTQSDLNRHMKSQIHMMKARNECKHCGEGFVSPMNLEKHYHEKHFSQFEQLATQAGTSK